MQLRHERAMGKREGGDRLGQHRGYGYQGSTPTKHNNQTSFRDFAHVLPHCDEGFCGWKHASCACPPPPDDSTSCSSQQVSVVWQLKAYETVLD